MHDCIATNVTSYMYVYCVQFVYRREGVNKKYCSMINKEIEKKIRHVVYLSVFCLQPQPNS